MAEEDNTPWYDKVSGFMGLGDNKTVDPNTGLTPQQQNLIGYNQLGSLGALLLAAGQKQMPSERAKYFAQIGNIPAQYTQQQQALMKQQMLGLQAQKLRQEVQGNEEFNARLKAAMGGLPAAGATGAGTGAATITPPAAGAATAGAGAGAFGNLTQEDLASLSTLPPAMRQEAAKQLMMKRSTETRTNEVPLTAEERKQMDIPEGQPAFKKVTYYPSGKTEVTGYHVPTINRAEDVMGKGFMTLAVKNFEESSDAAKAARDSMTTSNTLTDLLDEGIFSGSFAPQKLQAAKYAKAATDLLGIKPGADLQKTIESTEAYKAAVKDKVLGIAKSLGANPSNTDRDFALDVAGGNIALDEGTMRRILAKDAELNKTKIERHNQLVQDYQQGELSDSMKKLLSPLMKPVEAPAYVPKKKEAETPAPAAARTLAPQDQAALDWASKNPNDPRAAQIKQRLGVQ
jgi:hypothetical protein